MPKRYADSIVYDLKKYDQLKRVVKAQAIEVDLAHKVIKVQTKRINDLDSLRADYVTYYEEYEIPRHKRKSKILLIITIILTGALLLWQKTSI